MDCYTTSPSHAVKVSCLVFLIVTVGSENAFVISREFQKLTLDVIACCAFGIDTNSVKDPTSVFLEECRGLLATAEKSHY